MHYLHLPVAVLWRHLFINMGGSRGAASLRPQGPDSLVWAHNFFQNINALGVGAPNGKACIDFSMVISEVVRLSVTTTP